MPRAWLSHTCGPRHAALARLLTSQHALGPPCPTVTAQSPAEGAGWRGSSACVLTGRPAIGQTQFEVGRPCWPARLWEGRCSRASCFSGVAQQQNWPTALDFTDPRFSGVCVPITRPASEHLRTLGARSCLGC